MTTTFRGGNQVQIANYKVNNPISRFYNSKDLTPEKSTNYGVGFVLQPVDAVTITVDGYIINVRDRIGITRPFSVTQANINALPALSAVGLGGEVTYFTNGFNTSTKGIDIIASYRTTVFGAKANYTLAYNYNESKVTKFDTTAISVTQIYDIANFAPKHRVIFSSGYTLGNFSLNSRLNYYSSWSVANDYPTAFNLAGEATAGQRFGAKFTGDLDVSYTFADHFTFTVGANNLFDTKPDRIAPSSSNPIFASTNSTADGQIYPRSGGPFGINGGLVYARIGIKY